MDPNVSEWLNLLIRWMHVIAAIMWIGSSIFFNWLDGHLERAPGAKPGVEGELWMVHSGGFYQVEKKLVAPAELPANLHWFKWEAAFTWISGFLLLGVVYYMGGGVYLVDPQVSSISVGAATAVGIGTLVVSWAVYDTMWNSPLGKTGVPAIVVSFALVVAVAIGLSQILSGRAAYMHVGAMLGTLMVANVWMRIIPAQRALVAAVKSGGKPDPELARRAKQRSKHNNYMTYPVVFIMVSNHFPGTYGSKLNWAILAGFILVGAAVRHFMNVRDSSPKLVFAVLGVLFAVAGVSSAMMKKGKGNHAGATATHASATTAGGTVATADTAIDLTNAGAIHGIVHFTGTPPAPKELTIPTNCAPDQKGPVYADTVHVDAGGLANVFVWIKEGLPAWPPSPADPEVVIDQRGCIYAPRVLGAQVGQRVTFVNSDPVMHNVHAVAETNAGFNAPMPGKAMRMTRTFDDPEIMVHAKCDVHPWMSAFIGVVPHPYFAVSGAKGAFSMERVPPGDYVLEAWHEVYGRQTKKVTVTPKGTVEAKLTFSGG